MEGWDGDRVFYPAIQRMPDEDTLTCLSEVMWKADRKPLTQPVACLNVTRFLVLIVVAMLHRPIRQFGSFVALALDLKK